MSSYIRLEILLFFRAFETGVGMLVVYRLTALYQCNYGRIRFFMLAGVAFGGIFANFVLNRLLFLVKRCKISSYRHTKRRLWCNRRGRRFEKVKKEKK